MPFGWGQVGISNEYNAPVIRAQLNINSSSGPDEIGTDSLWRIKENCITQIGGWKWNDFGGEHFDAREFIQQKNLAIPTCAISGSRQGLNRNIF